MINEFIEAKKIEDIIYEDATLYEEYSDDRRSTVVNIEPTEKY